MVQRITLGISTGDPNGIGLEVALRSFADKRLFRYFDPVIFGSLEMVTAHQEATGLTDVAVETLTPEEFTASNGGKTRELRSEAIREVVRVVQIWEHEPPVEFGLVSAEGGQAAKESLERTAAALQAGHVDALVTPPIHKSAMQQAGFGFPGHTEYLEQEFGQGESLMLLVGGDGMRVALATNHLPLGEVVGAITQPLVERKIRLLHDSLQRDFGLNGPLIAVLGLNPHAGDGGAIGSEEETILRPAIEAGKAAGVQVMGPFPADGFFGSGQYRNFDGVLAMYHDQGLVAFKALAFGSGVNVTAGLSKVRTSPDHGTALEIAGKGTASADSFREAMFLAREIFLLRAGYDEDHADPLRIRTRDRGRGGSRKRRDGGGGRGGDGGHGGRPQR